MRSNWLQLHPTKTEMLWCSYTRHILMPTSPWLLTSMLQSELVMQHFGSYGAWDTVLGRSADAALCTHRHKVDCYSTVLTGISRSLLDRLQSVLNAANVQIRMYYTSIWNETTMQQLLAKKCWYADYSVTITDNVAHGLNNPMMVWMVWIPYGTQQPRYE